LTSWSWTSQLDVCSMLAACLLDVCSTFARCLLDVCYALCMLHIWSMFARCLLDVCWTFARYLLDVCSIMRDYRYGVSAARSEPVYIPAFNCTHWRDGHNHGYIIKFSTLRSSVFTNGRFLFLTCYCAKCGSMFLCMFLHVLIKVKTCFLCFFLSFSCLSNECDRETTDGEMCRNKQNRFRCKSDSTRK